MIVSSLLTTAALGMTGAISSGLRSTVSSSGQNAEGGLVQDEIRRVCDDLQKTQTFGMRNRVQSILRTVVPRRYGYEGWNGYGARPVFEKSIAVAESFIELLPYDIKDPVVRVVPDGLVSFSWKVGTSRLCTVAFDVDGRYHCASLIGTEESAITTNAAGEVVRKVIEVFA